MVQVTCDVGTLVIYPGDTEAIQYLRGLWVDPSFEKCCQNGDYDIKVINRWLGAEVVNYSWDTMLAEHLLHEETHYNLELLRGIYTENPVYERELRRWKQVKIQIPNGTKSISTKTKVPDGTFVKSGKNKGNPKYKTVKDVEVVEKFKTVTRESQMVGYASVPREILEPYGIMDSQTTHMVWREQRKLLTRKQHELLTGVVLPMQLALMEMEREGVLVDVDRLPLLRAQLVEQAEELKAKVFAEADEEFKLSSPVEVRRVLFEELGLPLPPIRSKKTREVGTGKKSLDWLSTHAAHPILKALGEWRATDQLLRTFVGRTDDPEKSLMAHLTADHMLHTTFRMTLETGRNSSSPNLQNLPTLSKGDIRSLIIAAPGCYLLQADYSQIELRIAAYESHETKLIEMLEDNGDVHCLGVGTPILTRDLQWVKAGEITAGTKILAIEEHASQTYRRLQTASITHAEIKQAPVFDVQLSNGETYQATAEHQWLVETTGRQTQTWVRTDVLMQRLKLPKVTYKLSRWFTPWTKPDYVGVDYDIGYVAGIFDGEGCLSFRKGSSASTRSVTCMFAQKPGEVADKTVEALTRLGFQVSILPRAGGINAYTILGGLPEIVRFLGLVRPVRLLKTFMEWDISQRTVKFPKLLKPTILSITPGGIQCIAALSSSTQTYIAAGYAAHNTYFARRLYPYAPDLPDAQWKKQYDEYRTLAKRFTFGRLFGQQEQGMALTFNISGEEAVRFQKVYSDLFPGMAQWWDDTIARVRRGDPLETVWGRQRRFPAYSKFAGINWRGKNGMFSHMDREALNFIPQGTAADVLSKACGNINKLIKKFSLPMRMKLVVHDSLTVECAKEYAPTAARILKAEMEGIGDMFGWKLPVEIKHGHTWAGELGVMHD